MQDRVAAVLLATVTTLARFIGVVLQAGEVGVERLARTTAGCLPAGAPGCP